MTTVRYRAVRCVLRRSADSITGRSLDDGLLTSNLSRRVTGPVTRLEASLQDVETCIAGICSFPRGRRVRHTTAYAPPTLPSLR